VGDAAERDGVHARVMNDVGTGRAVLFVVRHADAGTRTQSRNDDRRPLSALGREQAHDLAELLGRDPLGDILSSPFVRCVETLGPLAVRHERGVEVDDSLAEGAPIERLLDLVRRVPDRSVLCTHGDMLIRLISAIAAENAGRGPVGCFDKGVVWVLERANGTVSVADVIPPSTTGCPGEQLAVTRR
jgi:8-oxo-dGTP diphosphatase